MPTWQVILLGLLEGLTEFIPVSSTGHVLLAGHFLGFKSPGKTFEVLIQLGAIMAIVTVYFARILAIARALPSDARARQFVVSVVVAFLPAALVGALLHGTIKTILFETPALICTMLILGGIVLLVVDKWVSAPYIGDARDIPVLTAFQIGIFQTLAMIPGVSRSGATIVGAMLLGADKRAAAEFSFFLAIPTMLGAFTLDLYKNIGILDASDVQGIALGFAVAFVTAALVVGFLLDFISRHGLAPFGWWRILVGTMGLIGLALVG